MRNIRKRMKIKKGLKKNPRRIRKRCLSNKIIRWLENRNEIKVQKFEKTL